jgi:DNA-binding PadR family transcriptional regulator
MFAGFGGIGCGPWESRREGGFWGAGFDPEGWFFGKPRGRGGPRRPGRMFEQGDLKLVILRLLDEKPRHGYDIIKALEERAGGMYAPSPGTVYPTLTLLEDMGYARAREEEGGRKIYDITDAGRAYLAENRGAVDDLFERLSDLGAGSFAAAKGEFVVGIGSVARAAFQAAMRADGDRDKLRQVREVMDRAARDIDALFR